MADDLSLNFTKWFKKAPQESTSPSEEKSPPQDTSIDLSKINYRKIGSWFWQHRALFLVLIPLILSIVVRMQGVDVPIADDSANNQVSQFVHDDIQQAYLLQYPNLPQQNRDRLVNEDYQKSIQQPSYTIRTGEQRGQSFSIAAQKAAIASQFRSFFQYEANGVSYTYMPDIDPYTYLRWARNYLETGDIADERRNGLAYDNHMVAPIGSAIDDTIHPYTLAWLYRIMHVFNGKITLMQAASYFPVILIALSVIPVFFIGRRFGGNAAGFFAATIFAINAALLGRTNWGHADTDAYNVFFPLMTLWCYLEAYYHKDWKLKSALVFFAGLLTAVFAVAWSGWWYIFNFILAVAGIYFAYLVWMHRNKLKEGISTFLRTPDFKEHILIVIGYLIVSGIFVTMFINFNTFIGAPMQPFDFVSLKDATKITLFPNVLTTVAELNEAGLDQVVDQMGQAQIAGLSFFAIGVLGLLLLALPREKLSRTDLLLLAGSAIYYWIIISSITKFAPVTFIILFALPILVLITREAFRGICTFDIKLALFLLIWFAATMYASTKGIRFVMLLVPAFSIAFGTGIGLASAAISRWAHNTFRISQSATSWVIIGLFVMLLVGPAQHVAAASRNDLPIVNDAWYDTLTKIKDASQPTAIITSWWDFGHHFKYISDRRVTFDGASQNEPMAHWVGKILLTDDEKLAVGLLRMLDCGSTNAFDVLDAEVDDASVTVNLIYATVKMSQADAKKHLQSKGISDTTIDKYLAFTHCSPPEAFFIASGDMIGKSGVWAHFGSWDFNRADIWVFARKMSREDGIKFILENNDITEAHAAELYDEVNSITSEQDANSWIAPWPNYNNDIAGCEERNDSLYCGNGAIINLKTMDVTMNVQDQEKHPSVFAYPTATGTATKVYTNNTIPFSLTLIKTGDAFGVILANEQLANSVFTRMYFMQGHGLKYFKPFNVQRDASGLLIYTYKVDWTGSNTTLIQEMVP